LEQSVESDKESNEAIRNLVLLVASLSFCGHGELKLPTFDASTTLYQLDEFVMPTPENRGKENFI
jgi:WD repeat and FYVE domain-containing protein 3